MNAPRDPWLAFAEVFGPRWLAFAEVFGTTPLTDEQFQQCDEYQREQIETARSERAEQEASK